MYWSYVQCIQEDKILFAIIIIGHGLQFKNSESYSFTSVTIGVMYQIKTMNKCPFH